MIAMDKKQKLATNMNTGFRTPPVQNIPEDKPQVFTPKPTGNIPAPPMQTMAQDISGQTPKPRVTNPIGPVNPQQPIGVPRTSTQVTARTPSINGNRGIAATANNVNASQFGTGSNVSARDVTMPIPERTMTATQANTGGDFRDFEDRAYEQATSRYLNPSWDRARKDFDQRMINRGIDIGTEAYNEAYDAFSRSKNDAYSKAAFDAMGYGRDTQNMAFGQDLANAQMQNQAGMANLNAGLTRDNLAAMLEQNNANRSLSADTFNASNQLSRDNLMAQIMQGNASRDLQATGMNQANALNWGQIDASNAQANANRSLQASLANQSNQLQRDSLISQLMQRNADRNMQGDMFNAGHDLNELTTMANIDMGYGDRDYRDAVFNAQRDDLAYNRLVSILSGLNQGATPMVDVQGAYNNATNNAMNLYNAQSQAASNNMGGLTNLLGTGAMAYALSDSRLKTDIHKIGEQNGLNVYSFKYVWSDEETVGHMADEVEMKYPDAVITMPNGYKAVDYGAIR